MVKYLCVAEKPSISKSVAQILSGGRLTTRQARKPAWIRNYDFSYRMPPTNAWCDFTVTAVAGHLMSSDFEAHVRGWHSCDPFHLFDAEIKHFVTPDPDKKGIESNLMTEARQATHLMIWTDCDREGEAIGHEIVQVCRKANPRLIVKRARFSAIIANQINQACRNPVELDMKQANAVLARMDLDLRLGAAFTRYQTLGLQARFDALSEKVVSYGPCQFPTLGFVVDQYERVQAFISEPFWSIHVAIERDDSTTPFTWHRGHLFDRQVVEVLFSLCEANPEAVVKAQNTKPTQKWKPLPLTTVELQKTGSRLLRMTPKAILDTADSLYQKGFLSYPRTETDQFDPDFNFDEMLQKHTGDARWGAFTTDLVNGGFERPRNGKKNDKAHPPIHPTAHVNNLSGDDQRVYELVTRRFLACCSKNAKGLETTVEIEIGAESFKASGLVVLERNYLDVYVYDKWTGNFLPEFQVGERFIPDVLDIKEGRTSQPNLLTEADLVSLMDKNGIGTDATIAEHIDTVIRREYVMKQRQGNVEYLVPSTLGVGLVEGYNAIGFDKSLTKPHLRRLTEHRLTQICEGVKTRQQVIEETLDEFREIYIKTKQGFNTFADSIGRYIEGGEEDRDAGGGGEAIVSDGSDDEDHDGDGGGGQRPGARGRGRGRGIARGSRGTATNGRGAARGGTRGRGRGGTGQVARAVVKDDDGADDDDGDGIHMLKRAGAGDGGRARPAETNSGAVPTCQCDEPAILLTVMKESANKGRKFFKCSQGSDGGGCGFFEWADEETVGSTTKRAIPSKRPAPKPRSARSGEDAVESLRCACDLTPVERVTSKGANEGRAFFSCPKLSKAGQCKFFKWADELEGGGGVAVAGNASGSGSKGGSGSCFVCGEEGHWSSACPNQGKGDAKKARTGGSRKAGAAGGSGGTSGECFLCHEEGHWASNCPNGKSGASNGSGGRGTNGAEAGNESNYSCFKCGEQGHFSKDCTNGYAPAPTRGGSRGGRGSRGGPGRASERARGRGAR